MSKEQAERFVEAWQAKDPRIIEAFESHEGESPIDLEDLACFAGGIGYEATAAEFEEAFAKLRAAALATVGVAELSEKELAEVAGGGTDAKGHECMDTYDPNEKCYSNDRCWSTWNYYSAKWNCRCTYEDDESCSMNDRCNSMSNVYGCSGSNWYCSGAGLH